jgi:septum formation protein
VASPTDGAEPPQFVLASSSPRRRDLLAQHGYRVKILPAAIAESDSAALTVRELVLLNAGRKAAVVSQAQPESVVLGVDTLVSLDGRPLGKPADLRAAAAMLGSLAGREHQVYSGVCLTRLKPARSVSFVSVTRVGFRNLSARDIAAYLDLIDPLDKAGGYAAQEHGERIIAFTSGSWSNILGLPMETLARVLAREFSIRPGPAS